MATINLSAIKKKIRPNDRIIMASKTLDNIRNVKSQTTGFKPAGVWYGIGTSWIDWVEGEMPEWKGNFIYKLNITYGRVIRLTSTKDIGAFDAEYGASGIAGPVIDWRKVAKKYGGIEIAPYQGSARMKYMWYYPWDVASGCIWNKSLITNIKRITA